MQIGGYIMEAGATPEDIQTSPDMGVLIKREPKDISSPLSPTMEPDILDPADFNQWNNFTIKRELPPNEETIFEPDNNFLTVSVIPNPHEPKPNLKSQLKLHLESNPNYKIKLNLQDEIYKQQNLLINKETKKPPPQSLECLPNESIKNWLQRISQIQRNEPKRIKPEIIPPIASHRVVNYSDLPYMGEMTLDNCKPRRGRKPKKADICHLIYKNYGTIIPGNPQNLDTTKKVVPSVPTPPPQTPRTDVQNKIISSLLEKRLTLETKRNKEMKKGEVKKGVEEPLNLCVRDLNQLKIRLLRRHDNIYESQQSGNEGLESNVEVKLESPSDEEVEFVNETKSETLVPSSQDLVVKIPSHISTEVIANCDKGSTSSDPNAFVFWPNSGVFAHPMALQAQMLYYQKLAGNNPPETTSPTATTSSRPSSNASSASSTMLPSPLPHKATEIIDQPQKIKRAPSQTLAPPPTKRKRSAIFIPPIPTENQTNPATEVSICKFKFTGGAKPSLQEKKMLSVDSGGNFRYYSGTGDKSMRGYEFFPRETLQQQAAAVQQQVGHNSSSGVFLNASGEKIPSLPDNSLGLRPHFLLSGDTEPEVPVIPRHHSKKSRKSRKSVQREKLEQTFKEKGFLIQTQQLESAEGATYCKFRQLRKFTRYLFRSWKDYLPGNVRELQEGQVLGPGSSTDLVDGDKSDEEDYGDLTISSSSSVAKLLGNQGPSIDSESSNDQLTITALPD